MTNLLSKISFVDVETTGTSATRDRIIDIGIVRVEDGKIVEEFETLINPMTHLSPFISQMTSITPEMLYKAPTFEEVRSKVYDLLDGTLFVAHNAQFDYAFVRNEFNRLETKFFSKMLCTVRLSRLLFPEHHHHNLDSIIERFDIKVGQRHRAFPDAKALYYFLEKTKNLVSEDKFSEAIKFLTRRSRLPTNLNSDVVKDIPNLPGVYIFYDKDGTVLYVGKSTHLKDRINSHFSSFHSVGTDLRLASTVADIEVRRTAGDLSASLLEAELIKKLMPVYNRQLREAREAAVLIKNEDGDYHRLEIKRIGLPLKAGYKNIVSIYPSIKKAKEQLYEICKERRICPKKVGLEKGSGQCFNYQIGKCDGACIGEETPLRHNIKLIEAFKSYLIPKWPFDGEIGICEECEDLKEIVHVKDWIHIGNSKLGDTETIYESKESAIYTDTVKILKRFLRKREYLKRIVKSNQLEFSS